MNHTFITWLNLSSIMTYLHLSPINDQIWSNAIHWLAENNSIAQIGQYFRESDTHSICLVESLIGLVLRNSVFCFPPKKFYWALNEIYINYLISIWKVDRQSSGAAWLLSIIQLWTRLDDIIFCVSLSVRLVSRMTRMGQFSFKTAFFPNRNHIIYTPSS